MSTASATPGRAVTAASVPGRSGSPGRGDRVHDGHLRAVHLPRNTTPRTPSSSASRRRLAATATGSSPTPAERLNRANGPVERPPARVVTTRRTPHLRYSCQRFMNDGTSTSSSGSLAVAEADGSSDDENEE